MHLFPGVVNTFSHTHMERDTLVGSCTISEEEDHTLREGVPISYNYLAEEGTSNIEPKAFLVDLLAVWPLVPVCTV